MFTTQKPCNPLEKIYDGEFCYVQNGSIGHAPQNANIKNLFVFGCLLVLDAKVNNTCYFQAFVSSFNKSLAILTWTVFLRCDLAFTENQ